ncbi:MAG: reverse transcriptase family protein, partial [Nitrospirota bacterium]
MSATSFKVKALAKWPLKTIQGPKSLMDKLTSHINNDNEKQRFVENLANINRDVKVNDDIIELITAYTSLRLDREKEVIFYDDSHPSMEVFLHRKAKFDKDLEVFFKKNQHIDRKTLDFLSRYAEELNLRGAKFLISPAHLASILDLQENKLNWMASPNEKHYKSYVIKKRDGAKRFIFEPKPYLKETQKKILKQLLRWIRPEPQAEGFRKRRSILTNSKRHVGSNILIKIDLKDFFPTITYQRVFGLFKSLGYTDTVSACLTHLVTYNGRLPIGAPTSPALSNLICRRLDFRFSKCGEKMNFNYSRYADDIAISSERRDLNRYIPFFTSIIKDEGFDI